MSSNPDHVDVGIVINTFGVKGEVKILPLTDNPSDFIQFKTLFIGIPGEEIVEYQVRKARAHKKWVILRLEGVDGRDDATRLRDKNVYIHKNDQAELPDDTYLETDLLGLKVYTGEEELLGEITAILKTPANDIYQVEGESGREILIPAIKDVVKKVDLENSSMIVEPIQGLF